MAMRLYRVICSLGMIGFQMGLRGFIMALGLWPLFERSPLKLNFSADFSRPSISLSFILLSSGQCFKSSAAFLRIPSSLKLSPHRSSIPGEEEKPGKVASMAIIGKEAIRYTIHELIIFQLANCPESGSPSYPSTHP